ncbi:MAG: methyltransferase domain-containing protein [bacterium]|nr:methyltransferase domain-containing protein [bacterium]MDZ4231926.1 methyltransferase domain-containing protein [Candidatus Pacearchaeota archaeon]
MNALVELLEREGVLRSPMVRDAFSRVDRKDFVPRDFLIRAYDDVALPIGAGQTISQPYTVAFMLEHLAVKRGDHVMDVGHGSGWQSALLAHIVGERGAVYAIELVPELCQLGKANASKYPELQERITFYCQNAAPGLPEEAKRVGGFDAIIAAAEVPQVPEAWREQLKVGGRLVYPKGNSVFKEVKKDEGAFSKEEYHGFVFVPFIEPSNHR